MPNIDISRTPRRHGLTFKVGLQFKSVLILSCLMIVVTAVGGWLYYNAAATELRKSDYRHAEWMGQALAVAARQDIRDRRDTALQRLAGDCIRNGNVLYVSLLDDQGRILACASQEGKTPAGSSGVNMPLTLSNTVQDSDDILVLAKPVVLGKSADGDSAVIGAVRLVLDTSATAASLAKVQRQVQFVGAIIIVFALPLGYFMVWRLLIEPIRRLLNVTQDLARGNLASRSRIQRSDEMGKLSAAFDLMADELNAARDGLVMANERLEKKVAERTEEIQRVNCRLRDEIAEKEDFLRAVSHDLNAPLRNIAGMVAIIMAKYRGMLPEDVISRLDRVSVNVQTETSLIGDLLELSRIRTQPQKRQVVAMNQLIRDIADSFEHELQDRKINLTINEPMPRLYVEKNRIQQVFQNLLDNAIKYMDRRRDGRIEVDYRFVDGGHQFSVKDNGPGIAPDEHQKIFYVFRRAEDPNVARVEGKGVGLAIVKNIVSNYDGSVSVTSELGQGATFHVIFGESCARPPDEPDTDILVAQPFQAVPAQAGKTVPPANSCVTDICKHKDVSIEA